MKIKNDNTFLEQKNHAFIIVGNKNIISEFEFVFDGVKCSSIENLFQSFFVPDFEQQQHICFSINKPLILNNKYDGVDNTLLYWKGLEFSRFSVQYQFILNNIFIGLSKNKDFIELLLNTDNEVMLSCFSSNDPFKSIFTKDEFIARLNYIRKFLI